MRRNEFGAEKTRAIKKRYWSSEIYKMNIGKRAVRDEGGTGLRV